MEALHDSAISVSIKTRKSAVLIFLHALTFAPVVWLLTSMKRSYQFSFIPKWLEKQTNKKKTRDRKY